MTETPLKSLENGKGNERDGAMPGVQLRRVERQEGEQRSLYKYEVTITPTEITDCPELRPYSQVVLAVWSSTEINNWTEVLNSKNATCYGLIEGLASDHSEWDRTNCSAVETLSGLHKGAIKDSPFIAIAISNPGFGGSELATAEARPSDVTAEKGAELITGIEKVLQLPQDHLIYGGHSAGGELLEAYSRLYPDSPAGLVLFNPALTLSNELHAHFRRLGLLNKVGSMTPAEVRTYLTKQLMDLVSAGEEDSQTASRLVKRSLQKILGIQSTVDAGEGIVTEALKEQTEMHTDQNGKRPDVSEAKLTVLAENAIDAQPETIRRLLTFFDATQDRLTPAVRAWYKQYFEGLIQRIQTLDVALSETDFTRFVTALDHMLYISLPVTHDGIFIHPEAQKVGMQMLVNEATRQRHRRSKDTEGTVRIMQSLRSMGVPIHVTYDGPQYTDRFLGGEGMVQAVQEGAERRGVDTTAMQAVLAEIRPTHRTNMETRVQQMETLVSWANAEEIAKKWSDASKIEDITQADQRQFIETIFAPSGNSEYIKQYLVRNKSSLPNSLTEDSTDEEVRSALSGLIRTEDKGIRSAVCMIAWNIVLGDNPTLRHVHLNDWLNDSNRLQNYKNTMQQLIMGIWMENIEQIRSNSLALSSESTTLTGKLEELKKGTADWTGIPINTEDMIALIDYSLAHPADQTPIVTT